MSKTRDELAGKHFSTKCDAAYAEYLTSGSPLSAGEIISDELTSFKAGWDSALKNSSEVLALVNACTEVRDTRRDLLEGYVSQGDLDHKLIDMIKCLAALRVVTNE